MQKHYLAVAMFLALSGLPAHGQYESIVQACTSDVTKDCPAGRGQSGDTFSECIKWHFESFSDPCKAALVGIAAVRTACAADFPKQCGSVNPGSGRILMCFKEHYSALSDGCKTALGRAAEKRLQSH